MATIKVNTGNAEVILEPIPKLDGPDDMRHWSKMLVIAFRVLGFDRFITHGPGAQAPARAYQARNTGKWYRINKHTGRLAEIDAERDMRDRHAAMYMIESSITPTAKKYLMDHGYDDNSCEPDVLYKACWRMFDWMPRQEQRQREEARIANLVLRGMYSSEDSDGEGNEKQSAFGPFAPDVSNRATDGGESPGSVSALDTDISQKATDGGEGPGSV